MFLYLSVGIRPRAVQPLMAMLGPERESSVCTCTTSFTASINRPNNCVEFRFTSLATRSPLCILNQLRGELALLPHALDHRWVRGVSLPCVSSVSASSLGPLGERDKSVCRVLASQKHWTIWTRGLTQLVAFFRCRCRHRRRNRQLNRNLNLNLNQNQNLNRKEMKPNPKKIRQKIR